MAEIPGKTENIIYDTFYFIKVSQQIKAMFISLFGTKYQAFQFQWLHTFRNTINTVCKIWNEIFTKNSANFTLKGKTTSVNILKMKYVDEARKFKASGQVW